MYLLHNPRRYNIAATTAVFEEETFHKWPKICAKFEPAADVASIAGAVPLSYTPPQYLYIFLVEGLVGIIFTDGQHAVVYECDQVRSDGTCHPGHLLIMVYSRTREPLNPGVAARLAREGRKLCIDLSGFQSVNQDCKNSIVTTFTLTKWCVYNITLIMFNKK